MKTLILSTAVLALTAGLATAQTVREEVVRAHVSYLAGEALKGRRNQVFLVSKAGILPAQNSVSRRVVNKLLTRGRGQGAGGGGHRNLDPT